MQHLQAPIVFTTHAKERAKQRRIALGTIEQVLHHPDKTYPANQSGQVKFIRRIEGRQIFAIGQYLTDQRQWLILSVWVRGEDDQAPLAWQLLTLPFRASWWLLSTLVALLIKHRRSSATH